MRTTFSTMLCTLFVTGMLLCATGCFGLEHVAGNGAQTGEVVEARQWYVLFGLIPLNEVDTHAMAGGADNYTIETEFTFVDIVISVFTGLVTIAPKTVTVTK